MTRLHRFFSIRGPAKSSAAARRGDLSQGLINLMPVIYDLHWRLALGDLGQWTLGVLALIWTIDCFVGILPSLPFPRSTLFGAA